MKTRCRLEETDSGCGRWWCREVVTEGNRVEVLVNGEDAYPEMLTAAAQARSTLFVSCYQFEYDTIGRKFVSCLQSASARGVDVRVLLDAWGEFACDRSAGRKLRAMGLQVRTFHPLRRLDRVLRRYHRKFFLVDGKIGFTGGMNIRDRHLVQACEENPMRDTIFMLKGPINTLLAAVFEEDWNYCGPSCSSIPKESLPAEGDATVKVLGCGPPLCRTNLRRIILGRICAAVSIITVVTPFFFPDQELEEALAQASGRGVNVLVLVPTGDFSFLRWCSGPCLAALAAKGCKIVRTPPPYDHSKFMIVDDIAFIGTLNYDRRSFNLNWEIFLECKGTLANVLSEIVQEQAGKGRQVLESDLEGTFVENLVRGVILRTIGRVF